MSFLHRVLIGLSASTIATAASAGGVGTLMPEATAAMQDSAYVDVENQWHYIRFKPLGASPKNVCFAIYPGALIDPKAYAPYGQALAAQGYHSYILKVPFGLALFEPNAANDAKADSLAQQYCDSFVIAGHSLGGVVATDYIDNHPEDGLVLLASYPNETTSIADQSTIVSSIYGTNDCQTTPADIAASEDNLPPGTHFLEIPGGNHQQFAWYEEDVAAECQASVPRQYQFDIIIAEILDVLSAHE